MKNKIKELAQSPVITSDTDIQNFGRIMELSEEHINILHESKKIIKTYYLKNEVKVENQHIIEDALILISGNIPEEKKPQIKKTEEKKTPKEDSSSISNTESKLLKKLQYSKLTYLEKIFYLTNIYITKKIDTQLFNSIIPKLTIDPKDLSTIHKYKVEGDFSGFKSVVNVALKQLPKDKGLTYLEKTVLFAEHKAENMLSDEIIKPLLSQAKIAYKDFKMIDKILFSTKVVSEKEVLNIAKDYVDSGVSVGAKIPLQKIENFKSSIPSTIDETVLILIDLTIFGSADNAIAITNKGLYWQDDEDKGFLSWEIFCRLDIKSEDESTLSIGSKYSIDISSSDSSAENIVELFQELQSLENILTEVQPVKPVEIVETMQVNKEQPTKELIPNNIVAPVITNTTPTVHADIDINEALKNPYQTLHMLISQTFMYSTPVYALALHLSNNNLNNLEDENEDEEIQTENLRAQAKELSDKHHLEQIIVDAEKNFINLFESGISSTRDDVLNIMQSDIGNIFSYNNQVTSSLRQEMQGYRNLIIQKMMELNNSYQQLNQYWIQTQEGTGEEMTKFIKGGALGMMGAALLGPIGVAAAVGASYFNENESKNKKDAIEDTLITNWEQAHDSFYLTQLESYLQVYQALCDKISEQFIQNYMQAEQMALQAGKKSQFDNYLKSELSGLIMGEDFIMMRDELKHLNDMFK
jgi:hypothetical protein